MIEYVNFAILPSAVIGVILGFIGNHYVQVRAIPRLRHVEDLKNDFFTLYEVSAEYWTSDFENSSDRTKLEVKILTTSMMISLRCRAIRRRSKKLRNWVDRNKSTRLDLFEAVSGGCFQQQEWKKNPNRSRLAAKYVRSLIISLDEAS